MDPPEPDPPVNQAIAPILLEELDLGSARGGLAGLNRQPVTVEVVRALEEADLPAITSPPPVSGAIPLVRELRHSHHRLAELLASGKDKSEISLVTGYSISYISNIQRDPAFAELLEYYDQQKRTIFADGMERLRVIGIDASEMLHEQLHDPAVSWSKRELLEVIELALVKPAVAAQQAKVQSQLPGANLSLEVKFVGPSAAPTSGPLLDATFTDVTPGDKT